MISPTRAFYRPGETITIPVSEPFHAKIWHLNHQIAEVEGSETLRWQPPPVSRRGYRVRIVTADADHWTAFDVLEHWTDAPRYGYLFDFNPARESVELDWLLAHHVNGLQFYDWQYRHDTLLPPTDDFTDPLDRPLSLRVVRQLIDAAHTRGMVAMPYTAIYAASPSFAADHAEWGLYDEHGALIDFAEGFLKLTNPASPWREHFVQQCVAVLNALAFDGIHVDQYGEPRTGYDASGAPVDLPEAFVDTLRAVREAIPPEDNLLFNLVHNWPLDAISAAPVDFLYCELWPPQITLGDLAEVARQNRDASGGRIPVIAAYIDPEHESTVKLAESVIAASGAYHLIHGENGLYLSDPYFPLAKRPSPEIAAALKRLADFGVAYEELLAFAQPLDLGTLDLTVEGGLWVIPRRAENALVLNVINGHPDQPWNAAVPAPSPRDNIRVQLVTPHEVARIWTASPDADRAPQQLDFAQDNGLHFTLPSLDIWTLICIELKET